jgi:hypothetical protein
MFQTTGWQSHRQLAFCSPPILHRGRRARDGRRTLMSSPCLARSMNPCMTKLLPPELSLLADTGYLLLTMIGPPAAGGRKSRESKTCVFLAVAIAENSYEIYGSCANVAPTSICTHFRHGQVEPDMTPPSQGESICVSASKFTIRILWGIASAGRIPSERLRNLTCSLWTVTQPCCCR